MGRVLSKNRVAPEPYLLPYLRAAEKHGSAFPTLLWASPQTQSKRFDAIQRLGNLIDLNVRQAAELDRTPFELSTIPIDSPCSLRSAHLTPPIVRFRCLLNRVKSTVRVQRVVRRHDPSPSQRARR